MSAKRVGKTGMIDVPSRAPCREKIGKRPVAFARPKDAALSVAVTRRLCLAKHPATPRFCIDIRAAVKVGGTSALVDTFNGVDTQDISLLLLLILSGL